MKTHKTTAAKPSISDHWKNPDGTLKTMWWLVRNEVKSAIVSGTFETRPKGYYDGGCWGSISAAADSEADLRTKNGIPDDPCRECGQIFGTHYIEPLKSQLIAANICHTCHFWLALVDCKKAIRVDGCHYQDGGKTSGNRTDFNGFGGRVFHVLMNDGSGFITNNMWYQGEIPERFRQKLPDNAVFLKGEGPVSMVPRSQTHA